MISEKPFWDEPAWVTSSSALHRSELGADQEILGLNRLANHGADVATAVGGAVRRGRAVDAEVLEILACPLCKEEVKLLSLPEDLRATVKDRYRDKFRDEEPVVEDGLQCVKCRRIYPIVSDIPVMLIEEAIEQP